MLVAFGFILLSSVLHQRLAAIGAPVTGFLQGVLHRFTPSGLPGQFVLGALLGVVWTPCTGPTRAAAVTLAASSETFARAAFVMLFLGMGASLPLLAMAYGSRQTLKSRRDMLVKAGRAAKPAFGLLLAGLGLLVLFGADKAVESLPVDAMPDWLVALTTRF
jgi:cytochrome c-type biogenesis protein